MGSAALLPTAQLPPPPHNGKAWLDRAIDSGLTALNVTMGITGIGMGTDDFRSLLHTMHGYFCYFDLEPDRLLHVRTKADVDRAKRERKLGIIFGCQGLDTKIDGDASLLLIMAKLGQRIVQLTYNERGAIGCGALEPNDTGLTEFGRICIREINECGMIVDLAHAGQATALQAIEFCAMPPIVSHANACAVTDHPRNLRDDVLRALAAKGGVVGITAYAPFCETRRGTRPTIDDFMSHIAYVADALEALRVDAVDRVVADDRRIATAEIAQGFERVDDFAVLPASL